MFKFFDSNSECFAKYDAFCLHIFDYACLSRKCYRDRRSWKLWKICIYQMAVTFSKMAVGSVAFVSPGVDKLFRLADRFKSENCSRTGLKNKHKYSAIKFYFSPYYNSNSKRIMSLFCNNQTLPSWNDGTHRYPQRVSQRFLMV